MSGNLLLPLDGMLVQYGLLPSILTPVAAQQFAGTHLYILLGGDRHCESKVLSKNTT